MLSVKKFVILYQFVRPFDSNDSNQHPSLIAFFFLIKLFNESEIP